MLKIMAECQAQAQMIIDKTQTNKFLQFRAFDSPNARFIYVPLGDSAGSLLLLLLKWNESR